MINREFQIFVKPAGAECNLACDYCYYLQNRKLSKGKDFLMSDEILEKYIISHLDAAGNGTVYFSWHGGEPLLAGLNFYRKVVELQNRHKPEGAVVVNGIQTNGTLIDEEWCRFFAKERFSVGLSLDGPERFQNAYRRNRDGLPSFTRAVNGYRLLKKFGVLPEILCVVSAENVMQPVILYNFFKRLGARYMTFLPLVERNPAMPKGVSLRSVPSEAFGIFLSKIFDEWVAKDIGRVKIQIFEEAARTAFGQDHTLCIFKKECGGVPVVEHNGDFYSCDHYVDERHRIGNIREMTIEGMLGSKKQTAFGTAKLNTLPRNCVYCEVREMCNGECPKNRFSVTPDGEPGLNYLCEGYKYFFNHCKPFIEAISQLWKNQ